MRLFLKFLLVLTILLGAVSILLSRTYALTIPHSPGPTTDPQARTSHAKNIEEGKYDLVLIGDSTLRRGMDSTLLSALTGIPTYKIDVPGSASALWYIMLKNNVAESAHKPRYVIILFRDTILTAPGYRVQGSYFDIVDEYARRNEPVFIKKSFINQMSPLELAAEQYFPPYIVRTEVRGRIDAAIRYQIPAWLGCNTDCIDYELATIFSAAGLEPRALTNAVNSAESYLYTPDQLNFSAQVEDSYLPDMLQIANENNIKLIFVRIKVNTTAPSALDDLPGYIRNLENYLTERGAALLDYGNDSRLTPYLFADSIHLNEQGKTLFTEMVADGLKDLITR